VDSITVLTSQTKGDSTGNTKSTISRQKLLAVTNAEVRTFSCAIPQVTEG